MAFTLPRLFDSSDVFSSLGFTRRDLAKLGALVLATTFVAAITIPLEIASLPPGPLPEPVGLKEKLEIENQLMNHHAGEADVPKKQRDQEADRARGRANQIAEFINGTFETVRSDWAEKQSAADAAAVRLMFARCVWAAIVLAVFAVVPWLRGSLTAAVVVPVITSLVLVGWSFESGARVALGLSVLWAIVAFFGKLWHDNRQFEFKQPSWPRVALATVSVLPLMLAMAGTFFWLGQIVDNFLERRVLETEIILIQGVDAVSKKVDEAAAKKGNWWDPREWFFYSFVRKAATEYGQPGMDKAREWILWSYSALRTVYRLLEYLSVLSVCWVVTRTTIFVLCRAFLYGRGSFMFHLPVMQAHELPRR